MSKPLRTDGTNTLRSAPRNTSAGEWYRQPTLWLAAIVFAASIAGCVWMIVLGARFVDEPVPVSGEHVFKIPVSRPPADRNPQ